MVGGYSSFTVHYSSLVVDGPLCIAASPRARRLSTSRELLSWLTFPVHSPGSTQLASSQHLQTPQSAILLRMR